MEETLPEEKATHGESTKDVWPGKLVGDSEGYIRKEELQLISIILSSAKMNKYSNLLEQAGLEKPLEVAQIIKNDIEVISRFAKIISNPSSLELQQVHRLLEENIWLIDDHYRYYSSNTSLQKILESEIQKKYRKHRRKRPDIVCKNNYHDYVVIELKRPKHEINSRDFAQLLDYSSVIRAHCPNWKLVEGYLIGSRFDGAVRSEIRRNTGIHLLSYNEILSDVTSRYKRHLEIFNWRRSIDE